MNSLAKEIVVAARDSPLSKAQVLEVFDLLKEKGSLVNFSPHWIQTHGDLDQITPLSSLEKTDFFTREVDEAVLQGVCRIAIHSAKDLPEKISPHLQMVACTKSIDSSDVLVLRDLETLETLSFGAKIGTSSLRREENLRALHPGLHCVEIRGTIEKRLALLDEKKVDGVIIAKAALIRLGLKRNTLPLPGEVAPLQGRIAVLALKQDLEMKELFAPLFFSV